MDAKVNFFFIILLIIIVVIIILTNTNNLINLEPFCTKKSSDICLSRFTYTQPIVNSQALNIRKNSSVVVDKNYNGQTEKVMNFQCLPNSFPKQAIYGGTDCRIYPSTKSAENHRDDSSDGIYKHDTFYFNCADSGMGVQGCASGYTALGLKSYKDLGFTCDIGNKKIPTKIDPNTNVITCATDSSGKCLVRESESQCNQLLNLIPINSSGTNGINELSCSDGKIGLECTNMYNNLEIKTLKELGYDCVKTIEQEELVGKIQNNNSYVFPTYDSTNIINNCEKNINYHPSSSIKEVICQEYKTQIDPKYPNICEQVFTKFNLYPSSNPLVIKGNDPNYTIPNTFEDASSLFAIYSKYQNSFPPNTNSNSSTSIKEGVESILSSTPIKLGCCRRRNSLINTPINVGVRVPVNPTIESINPNTNKFNFQYSQITIPENSCPTDLYWGSEKCDNFFGLNCDNIINWMKSQNINVSDELLNYAPECACYAPQTKDQSGYPQTTPSVCYKNGCDLSSNPSVYIDPGSRNGNTVKTCDMTICNSINDFSGMNIGGNATISPQTSNQCGGLIQPTQTTPANSTPANSTPTNSTPANSTPTNSTPANSTSANSTPANSTPTNSTPANSTPANSTPANSTPANSAPNIISDNSPPSNNSIPINQDSNNLDKNTGVSVGTSDQTKSNSNTQNTTSITIGISVVIFILVVISCITSFMFSNKSKLKK